MHVYIELNSDSNYLKQKNKMTKTTTTMIMMTGVLVIFNFILF
jgi:hypothetical protein